MGRRVLGEEEDAFRSVAQLVEHRSPKPGVVGSSPSAPAIFGSNAVIMIKKDLRDGL